MVVRRRGRCVRQLGQVVKCIRSSRGATQICPRLDTLHEALSHVTLDPLSNEVLLLHGTPKADDIVVQGFDDRVNRRGLYGAGVCLSIDACIVLQYCEVSRSGELELVVARAILGHPYMATGTNAYAIPPWLRDTGSHTIPQS